MDVYMYIYETRMFELDILESYTNMENINESIGSAISSIIKKIFGTIVKVIKGIFGALGRLFGLGKGGDGGSTSSKASKLENSETKKNFESTIDAAEIDKIVETIADENFLEDDRTTGIKYLKNVLSHPRPVYDKFDKLLDCFNDSEIYNITDEKYKEKILKKMCPGMDIDVDKDTIKIPEDKIAKYFFEESKTMMSQDETRKFINLYNKLKKTNDNIARYAHRRYESCMRDIEDLISKDAEDKNEEILKIKKRLNQNMEFLIRMSSEILHKPMSDAINYVNVTTSIHELIARKKVNRKGESKKRGRGRYNV